MTTETRTTIQLRDITEVEIECGVCHTRIAWQLRSDEHFIPSRCNKHNCDNVFFVENSPEHRDLMALLSHIIKYSYSGPYVLKFAIGEPKETK
jgi:hypothetical protein